MDRRTSRTLDLSTYRLERLIFVPNKISVISSPKWRLAQFLERLWWQRYLQNKSPEQYLTDKRAYWQRVLKEIAFKPTMGAKALDAGCGPAGIFILLGEQQQMTAIDPLLDHYETDLAIFSKKDHPLVSFRTEAIESSQLDTSFAEIYCFNAINHVADWELALDRFTQWAEPGTRMLLSSDVHRHAWLLPIFRCLPGDMLHPQQHDPEAYRKALKKRGWTVKQEKVLRRELIFDYTVWECVLQK